MALLEIFSSSHSHPINRIPEWKEFREFPGTGQKLRSRNKNRIESDNGPGSGFTELLNGRAAHPEQAVGGEQGVAEDVESEGLGSSYTTINLLSEHEWHSIYGHCASPFPIRFIDYFAFPYPY